MAVLDVKTENSKAQSMSLDSTNRINYRLDIIMDWTPNMTADYKISKAKSDLKMLVSARGNDLKIAPNTILGVLEHNENLGDNLFLRLNPEAMYSAEYGLYANDRGADVSSVEARISLSVDFYV